MPTRETTIHAPPRPAPQDDGGKTPPFRPAPRDATGPAPRDTLPPAPAYPGLTRGVRAITPNKALRLEALLGEYAETWPARLARHDVHVERARMAT